jgi:hypothetical protein
MKCDRRWWNDGRFALPELPPKDEQFCVPRAPWWACGFKPEDEIHFFEYRPDRNYLLSIRLPETWS